VQAWDFRAPERNVTVTVDVGDRQVQVHDLTLQSADVSVTSDQRIWIAGEEGFEQAPTGSVIRGSRAFIAAVSSSGLEQTDTLGNAERRNGFVAFAELGPRRFVIGNLDFPKTHDADERPDQAFARTVLYEITPTQPSQAAPAPIKAE